MQNVVIVGTGLIGASFGLALRKAGFAGSLQVSAHQVPSLTPWLQGLSIAALRSKQPFRTRT